MTSNRFIPPAKPIIGEEERSAVDRVLRSGMIAQGPEVAAFEREFAEHFGLGRACVAVGVERTREITVPAREVVRIEVEAGLDAQRLEGIDHRERSGGMQRPRRGGRSLLSRR